MKTNMLIAACAAALTAFAAPAGAVMLSLTGTADGSASIDEFLPPVSSTVSFGNGYSINDINVEVNLVHSWVADLFIDLTGPDGTSIRLMGDGGVVSDGGSGDNLVMTVFDDEASRSITTAAPGDAPYSGSWIPREALSNYDGMMLAGDWTLTISDAEVLDSGTFDNWTMFVDAAPLADVPAPGALALLGLGALGLAARRRRG